MSDQILSIRHVLRGFANSALLLGLLVCALPVQAQAASSIWQPQQMQESKSYAPQVSIQQATKIAREQTGGRVLSAQPSGDGYVVRMLLDGGRVKSVFVDSQASSASRR